jgi:hypothetical protein
MSGIDCLTKPAARRIAVDLLQEAPIPVKPSATMMTAHL